jgi:hypothetical protein
MKTMISHGLTCLLLLILTGAASRAQYVYWVDGAFSSPTLNRVTLSGGDAASLPLASKSLPEGLVHDPVHNILYFGEMSYSNANVNRALPTLASAEGLVAGGSAIRGIAVDAIASQIFWTSSNIATGSKVERANLDGSNRRTVFQQEAGKRANFRGIAVNGPVLYWADFDEGTILTCDTAGSGTPTVLVAGLDGPVGVAVGGGYLYWTEANANVIKRYDLSTRVVTTIVSGLSRPNYIAVDEDAAKIVWTEIGKPCIKSADLTGQNVATLAVTAGHPTGIAITSSIPLPVQLSSFTCVSLSGYARLEWRTLSEMNNYGFFVQRKLQNETVWADLPNSFIGGHGTTADVHGYSFTDSGATTGQYMYRLRQVDLDGTVHFSASVSINGTTSVNNEQPTAYALEQNYPNPFNPTTNIRYQMSEIGYLKLAVYDMLGREVAVLVNERKEAGVYSVTWNAAGIASGMYVYRMEVRDPSAGSGKGYVQSRTLLLLK